MHTISLVYAQIYSSDSSQTNNFMHRKFYLLGNGGVKLIRNRY